LKLIKTVLVKMRAGFCLFRQILASQKEVREPWKTRSEEKGVTGMPEVRVNHVILHYEEMGQGADTLVFSHSYLVDSSHFYPQMKALSDRYRCLAYDHRGHGRSEVTAGGYDMENLFADAVGFIEKMNCAPCHFIGLSTGGFIGLRIGIRRPDLLKTLILMDTSAEAEPKQNLGRYKILLFVVRWFGYRPAVGRVVPLFFGRKFLNDPARKQEVADWRHRLMSNDRKAMVKFGKGIFARQSVYEQLDQIKTPTMMVVGAEDFPTPVGKAERIAQKIPGAKLVVIPDAGHLCTVDEPIAVTSAIQEFLAAH
jgi:3-oxoadipate enol-lactonase